MRDGDDDDNDNRSLPTINKTCGIGYFRHVDPYILYTTDSADEDDSQVQDPPRVLPSILTLSTSVLHT